MAILRRASAFPTGGNSATVTVTIPAGVQVGDFMLLAWSTALNTAGWTDPAGWTLLESATGSSTNYGLRLFSRVAQSGDASTVVTCTTPGATRQVASIVAYYSDTGGSSVLLDESAIAGNTATIPTNTTTAADTVRVAGCGVRNNGDETWTVPASPVAYTEVGESHTSVGTGGKSQVIAEYLTTVAAGTNVGTGTFTSSAGTSRVAWIASLKEVGAGGADATMTVTGGTADAAGNPVAMGVDLIDALDYPLVIAHRGGGDNWPENTMTAFNGTHATHPHTILECDVRVNQSGSLVLMHDATVDRTAGASETGNVTDYTDTEWDALTVAWPIPPGGSAVAASYWADLRDGIPDAISMPEATVSGAVTGIVADVTTDPNLKFRVIGQAFNKTNAATLAASGIRVVQLYGGAVPNIAEDVTNDMWAIGMDKGSVNFDQALVDDAHTAGLLVFVYTVDTTSERDDLFAMGVDGVWTNDVPLLDPAAADGTLTIVGGSAAGEGGTVTLTGAASLTVAAGSADAAGGTVALTGAASLTVVGGDAAAAGGDVAMQASGTATLSVTGGTASADGGSGDGGVVTLAGTAVMVVAAGEATADGGSVTWLTVVLPSPPDRTVAIGVESRTYAVAGEHRATSVPVDNRSA